MNFFGELTRGLWKEIPPYRLVLGLCPSLACSKSAYDGLGMGICLTFVLVGSNVLISALRNIIPAKVRIACFIIVVATFVVIVERYLHAYVPSLYVSLGVFIPLIVVNCIPLGRAEAYASRYGVGFSFADGLGLGLGYTISLFSLGCLREILGNGTISLPNAALMPQKFAVFSDAYLPFTFLLLAPGAFVCLGSIFGVMSLMSRK